MVVGRLLREQRDRGFSLEAHLVEAYVQRDVLALGELGIRAADPARRDDLLRMVGREDVDAALRSRSIVLPARSVVPTRIWPPAVTLIVESPSLRPPPGSGMPSMRSRPSMTPFASRCTCTSPPGSTAPWMSASCVAVIAIELSARCVTTSLAACTSTLT